MKKILMFIVFAGCVSALSAQQKSPFKGTDSLLNQLNKSNLKPLIPFKFTPPPSNNRSGFNQLLVNNFRSNIDHMPVAVLAGNSKMPVIKPGGYYTMPVVKPGGNDPLTVERIPPPLKAP